MIHTAPSPTRRRRAVLGALALLLVGPLAATQVQIPAVRDGSGNAVPARLTVRLVRADGRQALVFAGADLHTEYVDLDLSAGQTIELTPQAQIALPDGAATYYDFAVRVGARTETYRVQVPDVPGPLALRDLIGAAAIAGDPLVESLIAAIRADRVQTGTDATTTNANRVQTGQDVLATAADRVQTGLDVIATAANRVQTGQDTQTTAAAVMAAQAVAADLDQRGLDAEALAAAVAATAADRVQTGADVVSANAAAQTTTADLAAVTAQHDALVSTHSVREINFGPTDWPVIPQTIRLRSLAPAWLGGLVCDVATAPVGPIGFDLRTGDPLASIYPSGQTPTILTGDTTTLTGHPDLLETPVAVPAHGVIELVIAPSAVDYSSSVATVAALPVDQPLGTRLRVLADGHTWERQDATTYLDAVDALVASASALPTTLTNNRLALASDTSRLWAWSGSAWVDQGVPAAITVAVNPIYKALDTGATSQWNGSAWVGLGTPTSVASSDALPVWRPTGTLYRTTDTGNLYVLSLATWIDNGVPVTAATSSALPTGQWTGQWGLATDTGIAWQWSGSAWTAWTVPTAVETSTALPEVPLVGAVRIATNTGKLWQLTDFKVWEDRGVPTSVANAAALPSPPPAGAIQRTADSTYFQWRGTALNQLGLATTVATAFALPATPAAGPIYVTLDTRKRWQWAGPWTDLGVGYDVYQVGAPLTGTLGQIVLVDTGYQRYRIDRAPWFDAGPAGQPGAGLTCSVVTYPREP